MISPRMLLLMLLKRICSYEKPVLRNKFLFLDDAHPDNIFT